MAIAKARSSSPVRGYYVTTINTGRVVQLSGAGFGLSRLGGLINAQVEGLTGGGSATGRLAAQAPDHFSVKHSQEEEKARVQAHAEWKKDVKESSKEDGEAVKKGEEIKKKLEEEAKHAKPTANTVDLVKDPNTDTTRVVGKDNAVPEDLDDPKKLAAAAEKAKEKK